MKKLLLFCLLLVFSNFAQAIKCKRIVKKVGDGFVFEYKNLASCPEGWYPGQMSYSDVAAAEKNKQNSNDKNNKPEDKSTSEVDYSYCNESINKIFDIDSTTDNGFISINDKGVIQPQKGNTQIVKNVLKNSDGSTTEGYKFEQVDATSKNRTRKREFKVIRKNGAIQEIKSKEDIISFKVVNNKCVPAEIYQEYHGKKEKFQDLLACKTIYELNQKYKDTMLDCYKKARKTYDPKTMTVVDIQKKCKKGQREIYKTLSLLKNDLLERSSTDKSLSKKPFEKIEDFDYMYPLANDHFIDSFVCGYESIYKKKKPECSNKDYDFEEGTETNKIPLLLFLKTASACDLSYPNPDVFNDKSLYARRYRNGVYKFKGEKKSKKNSKSSTSQAIRN